MMIRWFFSARPLVGAATAAEKAEAKAAHSLLALEMLAPRLLGG